MLRGGVARGGWGPPVGSEPTQLTRKEPSRPQGMAGSAKVGRKTPAIEAAGTSGQLGHWPRIILDPKDETMARLHDATDAQRARRTSASTGPTRRRLLKSAALATRKKGKKKCKGAQAILGEYIHTHVKIDIQIYPDIPLYISI